MRHIVGKLSTSSFQRYKVCANRSSDEGVMAPGSRGVGAVFVHFSDADSGQTGDAIGEPRVPRRSRSHYLSNAPGLADQLVASRKDSAREGGSCAAYFCKVPDSRESELGLVRYGPASRVHRGVFGPFEGSFPIGIPADPDKFLAIREFHVVHGCVLFPMCPGSQINLLRVRKTLCASVATSALHRGEFGFARYDPANGGRRNVPYAKGTPIDDQFSPIRPTGTNWDLTLVKSQLDNQTWFGNSSKRSGTNWDLTFSRIAIGCLIEVVGVGAIAGPHALDSCECMNIEGILALLCFRCHASSIEVVVALSVGSKCTRIPYFRLSYLIGLTPSRGPFLSSLGLTPSRGPFQKLLGLTLPRGPFLSSLGLTSFTRPISSSSGLTPSRGPFLSMSGLTPSRGPFLSSLGLTPSRGPFQQILGLTLSRGPFLSMSGLTPSRGPFHHHRVLLLHEAHFSKSWVLLFHEAHFSKSWVLLFHEVKGGRVMGGVAMDSHHIRSSGQIERLESEVLRLQLELSLSMDRHTADMDRVQGEMASMQTEAIQMRRDLASRDAEVTRLAAAVRRLEEQLQGMGITPVTGADLSGPGQPSSSPPRDPVSRDWFFDDPSPP
uniref:Uncharacterized protein n=1 Tax=Fagus sylvatica TaxID=28930 RepID=A0A2N9FIT7_FAGSY